MSVFGKRKEFMKCQMTHLTVELKGIKYYEMDNML